MENKGINKGRVSLGAMICLMSYFIICIIIKAFGIDLFDITNHIGWAADFSMFVYSNIFVLTAMQTIFMCVNLFFVLSVSAKRYDSKKITLINLILYIPTFGVNLLANYLRLPSLIVTVVVPFIYCLFLVKERTFKGYLLMLVRYIIFSAFIILVEFGLMYLKVSLLKFNYNAGNVLNVILLNLDLFVIYFSTYFLLKYTKLRESTCNLCKRIFKKKQKKEDMNNG